MKKILFSVSLFLCRLISYADYSGTVTTNPNDLSFSTNSGYDLISLKSEQYTTEISAPQLPVKTLSFLIPIDKAVSSVTINSTTIQQLSGFYTIYPVQTPVLTNPAPASSGFDNPNPAIYNSTNPYPSVIYSTENDGYPFGYHVVTINFW